MRGPQVGWLGRLGGESQQWLSLYVLCNLPSCSARVQMRSLAF